INQFRENSGNVVVASTEKRTDKRVVLAGKLQDGAKKKGINDQFDRIVVDKRSSLMQEKENESIGRKRTLSRRTTFHNRERCRRGWYIVECCGTARRVSSRDPLGSRRSRTRTRREIERDEGGTDRAATAAGEGGGGGGGGGGGVGLALQHTALARKRIRACRIRRLCLMNLGSTGMRPVRITMLRTACCIVLEGGGTSGSTWENITISPRSPIVGSRRRICIGFAFGHESGSPYFVLRRRMANGASRREIRPQRGTKGGDKGKHRPQDTRTMESQQWEATGNLKAIRSGLEWMGGWMDGWADGWLVGWLDGWLVGWQSTVREAAWCYHDNHCGTFSSTSTFVPLPPPPPPAAAAPLPPPPPYHHQQYQQQHRVLFSSSLRSYTNQYEWTASRYVSFGLKGDTLYKHISPLSSPSARLMPSQRLLCLPTA
ncbi:hypothetical protein V1478_015110, partial [Vespula squamosa]